MSDDATHIAETTPVQLTRMEGKLDLITAQVNDLRQIVGQHSVAIDILKSQTQSLKDGSVADKDTAVALALALKDAKETAEGAARAEQIKADAVAKENETKAALGPQAMSKLYAAVGAVLAAILIYQNVTGR